MFKCILIALAALFSVEEVSAQSIVVRHEPGCIKEIPGVRFIRENRTNHDMRIIGIPPWQLRSSMFSIMAIKMDGTLEDASIPWEGYGPQGGREIMRLSKRAYWVTIDELNMRENKDIKGYFVYWGDTISADNRREIWYVPMGGAAYFPVKGGKLVCVKQLDSEVSG